MLAFWKSVLPTRTRFTWWCCQCQRGEHFTGPDARTERVTRTPNVTADWPTSRPPRGSTPKAPCRAARRLPPEPTARQGQTPSTTQREEGTPCSSY